MIYVVPSKRIKEILKDTIAKTGDISKFSEQTSNKAYNIRRWRRGTRTLPFDIIKTLADSQKLDVWEFLDNERLKAMTTSNSFRISYKITTSECLLLGWVLSEGHLARDRVTISQNERQPLEMLRKIIVTNFNITNGIRIERDRRGWKLVINSSAFPNYLNLRYGIPYRKKSSIIRVPVQIFEISDEEKYAFLAGCLEGDGSFIVKTRKSERGEYRIPQVSLTSYSRKFLEDINFLLKSLDIKSTIHSEKLLISKADDCAKLFFKIIPYMIHNRKIKDFMKSLIDFQYLNAIPIANSGELVKKWKNELNITWIEFTKIIEKECKYKASYYTTSNWGYNNFSPPITVIIKACEELGENYFEYLPEWTAALLLIHNKIDQKDFENIRGVKLPLINMEDIASLVQQRLK